MNQQVLAVIFTSVISTYFGVLILMYVSRTFLACALSENPSDRKFTPASSSEVEVETLTNVAVQADLLAN